MAYIDQAYIEQRYGKKSLQEICDSQYDELLVDTVKLTNAISDADILIDSFLINRYTVPLTSFPDVIKLISYNLTIYNLHSDRYDDDFPKHILTQYKDAISLLVAYRDGKNKLPSDIPEITDADGIIEVNKTENDRVFGSTFKDQYRNT